MGAIDENAYFAIQDIFNNESRSRWKELITPYINYVDKDRWSAIGNDNSLWAFIPEELDHNYNWKFNIGDIVTDGKDIMKIVQLPILDIRREFNVDLVQFFGNRYTIIRLDENGEDKEKDNPTAYLHQDFNENQIWLVE